MPLNDNDLLLINDSQDSNEAKKIKYSTLKSNINGDDGNDLQAVTDNGNTTTNGITLPRIAAQPASNADAYIQATNQTSGKVVANHFGDGTINLSDDLNAQAKIQLKGSDGSAEFAGTIDVGASGEGGGTAGEGGVTINEAGVVQIARPNGDWEIFQGFTSGSNVRTSKIFAGGSAEFGSGNILLKADGTMNLQPADGTGTAFFLQRAGTATNQPSLRIRTNSTENFRVEGDGTVKVGGVIPTTPNITLNSDGSASFAGPIDVGTVSGSTPFAQITAGSVQARPNAFSDLTFAGYATSGATPVFSVNGQGSAKFGTGNNFFDWRQANGVCQISTNASNSSQALLYGESQVGGSTFEAFKFTAGGTANFAGSLSARGLFAVTPSISVTGDVIGIRDATTNDYSYVVRGTGTVEIGGTPTAQAGPSNPNIKLHADGSGHFKGNVTSDGTIGFNLEADNPANFNAEGEYTGPTLDVKERVMNLISRLDAIEANEVIDDATDSSLLQLVASASSRLDSLEARIAALEGGN